jgi:hypothetical protein
MGPSIRIHPSGSLPPDTRLAHKAHTSLAPSRNFSIHDAAARHKTKTPCRHKMDHTPWSGIINLPSVVGRVGYKERDARAVFPKLYGSCNSPPGWLSAGAAQQAHTYPTRSIFINSCERIFHKYTILLLISRRNSNPAWNSYCCRAHKARMDAEVSALSLIHQRFHSLWAPREHQAMWCDAHQGWRAPGKGKIAPHSSALRFN